MRRTLISVAVAALAFGPVSFAPAFAQAVQAAPAAAPAKPAEEKKPKFINPADYPPALILPPPPAPDSARTKAELAELHAIQAARTPAQLAAAQADDKEESIFLFATVFGAGFNAKALPKTAALGAAIRNDMGFVENAAKDYFHRNRPYFVDATIKGCEVNPSKATNTSYPSGHSASGFVLGVVLAQMIPDRAADILARSRDYAEQRLICGLHYRSDTGASQTLATLVARDLIKKPEVRAMIDASVAELKAANLIH